MAIEYKVNELPTYVMNTVLGLVEVSYIDSLNIYTFTYTTDLCIQVYADYAMFVGHTDDLIT